MRCLRQAIPKNSRLYTYRKMMPLVLLFACLFPVALPRQCFLDALPLTGLQVEGVTLHFFDDVLLLHLPLKTTQCIFERLAFLHTNLSQ